jgi:hypothetical protein
MLWLLSLPLRIVFGVLGVALGLVGVVLAIVGGVAALVLVPLALLFWAPIAALRVGLGLAKGLVFGLLFAVIATVVVLVALVPVIPVGVGAGQRLAHRAVPATACGRGCLTPRAWDALRADDVDVTP